MIIDDETHFVETVGQFGREDDMQQAFAFVAGQPGRGAAVVKAKDRCFGLMDHGTVGIVQAQGDAVVGLGGRFGPPT